MDIKKIGAAIDIGLGLIKAGSDILDLLKKGNELTPKQLQEIIAKQNAAQAKASAKLKALLD